MLAQGGFAPFMYDARGGPNLGVVELTLALHRVRLADGSGLTFTEHGKEKRLAVYVVRNVLDVPGVSRLGTDILDPTVTASVLASALRDDTILAAVMYANNEIGTVQPVRELAELARARGVVFLTDAVQAPGQLPVARVELGRDATVPGA